MSGTAPADDTAPGPGPMPADGTRLRPAVLLASAGRPELLATVIRDLAAQTVGPVPGVLSVPDRASLPGGDNRDDGDDSDDNGRHDDSARDDAGAPEPALAPPGWRLAIGTRGLAAQRNAGLDALLAAADGERADIVFCFDDDAVVRPDYIERALDLFERHPEVVALTGRVIADGATRGEIPDDYARAALAASAAEPITGAWRPTRELYGCNFAVRLPAADRVRFDGRLPLYSWLEDHDFARRLRPHGVLAVADDCVIVHRGAASGGRQAHVRLGYSQIMNPVHLRRKGSFPAWLTLWEIFRPTAKNVALSIAGPSADWRRLRLRGNLLAAADVLRNRITPERITEL